MNRKCIRKSASTSLANLFILAFVTSVVSHPALSQVAPIPTGKVCVDFEKPLTIGTKYIVGFPVVNVHGITVSVTDFTIGSSNTATGYAFIDDTPMPTGSGQNLRASNANLFFDFSGVGFEVGSIMFAFLDMGGDENLAVNGLPRFVGELSAARVPFMVGNAEVGVQFSPVSVPGNIAGTVSVDGLGNSVRYFEVGGQEFWIDTVCVSVKQ